MCCLPNKQEKMRSFPFFLFCLTKALDFCLRQKKKNDEQKHCMKKSPMKTDLCVRVCVYNVYDCVCAYNSSKDRIHNAVVVQFLFLFFVY